MPMLTGSIQMRSRYASGLYEDGLWQQSGTAHRHCLYGAHGTRKPEANAVRLDSTKGEENSTKAEDYSTKVRTNSMPMGNFSTKLGGNSIKLNFENISGCCFGFPLQYSIPTAVFELKMDSLLNARSGRGA
jgi:hypothetical protein